MYMMDEEEKKELERYREKAKKGSIYRNKFAKEKYKRLTCLYPIDEAHVVEELLEKENISQSSYIIGLIRKDLKERGLI